MSKGQRVVSVDEYRAIIRKLTAGPIPLPAAARPRPGCDSVVRTFHDGTRVEVHALWWAKQERDQLAEYHHLRDHDAQQARERPRKAQRLSVEVRVRAVDVVVSKCITSLRSRSIPPNEWVAGIYQDLRAARLVRTRKQIKALVRERHGITLPRQRKRRLAR